MIDYLISLSNAILFYFSFKSTILDTHMGFYSFLTLSHKGDFLFKFISSVYSIVLFEDVLVVLLKVGPLKSMVGHLLKVCNKIWGFIPNYFCFWMMNSNMHHHLIFVAYSTFTFSEVLLFFLIFFLCLSYFITVLLNCDLWCKSFTLLIYTWLFI